MSVSRRSIQQAWLEGILGAEPSTDRELANLTAGRREDAPSLVAVIGLGYVGLPTALAFFSTGIPVIGLDTNPHRLLSIRSGQVDLLPTDRARLEAAISQTSFGLTDDLDELETAEAVVICVPTPVDAHSVPDLTPLRAACRATVNAARPGQTIVLTSTSFVGTTRELLIGPLTERGLEVGQDLHVAFSPERVDPGNCEHPPEHVPRVIGGATPACTAQVARLFGGVATSMHVVSSPEAAEMTKLYENIFRAVNIALANELADVSQALRLNVMEVIEAASTKPYGFMPFYPGPGVGGHCIPCDPHYLLWQLRASRTTTPLIGQAMECIATRPLQVVNRIIEALAKEGPPFSESRVLLAGITYKPGVADIRESPALTILAALAERGVQVAYHDPLVPYLPIPGGRRLESVPEPAAARYDLVVVHTLHPGVDYEWIADQPLVIDATYRLQKIPHHSVA